MKNTAAGPGGGADLGRGVSVAPPPTCPPAEPAPAAIADCREHSEGAVGLGHWVLSAPATRGRVVLLPHTRTEPPDIRPTHRRAASANGMNHDDSPRQHPAQSDGTTCVIAASRQWHDVELAMKVARHSFDRWLTADHEDTPSLAIIHAHHTRTAVREAARAITMLIDTFLIQETELITTLARTTDTPTQRR
ncbi:MAG: hypothetical protein ACRDRW_17020 [Pseudonocardiaceae bacterium]